jgi:Mn-dependent transcriptional regulator
MEIRKSAEDYLEMMLMLQEKHGYIRSIDIAEELHVKKPSVSFATKRLRENGYITWTRII